MNDAMKAAVPLPLRSLTLRARLETSPHQRSFFLPQGLANATATATGYATSVFNFLSVL